jgi:hypothetical protein
MPFVKAGTLSDPDFYRETVRAFAFVATPLTFLQGVVFWLNRATMLKEQQVAHINLYLPLDVLAAMLMVGSALFFLRATLKGPWWFGLIGCPMPLLANALAAGSEIDFAFKNGVGWMGVLVYGFIAAVYSVFFWATMRVDFEQHLGG